MILYLLTSLCGSVSLWLVFYKSRTVEQSIHVVYDAGC
jgi:hypothetical protein